MRHPRRAALVCLAIALATTIPSIAVGAPRTITRAEYAIAVERAQTEVAGARARIADPEAAKGLAARLLVLLPDAQRVTDGGRTYDADAATVTLIRRLEGARPGEAARVLADLSGHLASLRAALGSPAAPAPSDPAALRELLKSRRGATGTGQDWLGDRIRQFLEWLSAWLARLGLGGGRAPAGIPLTTWIVLAVPTLIALVILVRALIVSRRRAARLPGAGSRPDHTEGPVVAAAADLPDDPLAFADALAARGRRREAMRALYGGAARRLVDAGAIRRMRTRTNAELLRDVRQSAALAAPALAALTTLFEAAWYGHGDPGEAGIEAARRSYAEVVLGAERMESTAGAGEPA